MTIANIYMLRMTSIAYPLLEIPSLQVRASHTHTQIHEHPNSTAEVLMDAKALEPKRRDVHEQRNLKGS